jgi:hypothetical protein
MTSAEINIAIAQACGWTDWELSRQRGNMLHALHEISAAVKRGMKQGGATKTK